MPNMRAKVAVRSIGKAYEGAETLRFAPVMSNESFGPNGESENNTYARYTPSGAIDLTVTNPDLLGKFSEGEEYYVDFTPANENAAGQG